jgi:hypothetical protein
MKKIILIIVLLSSLISISAQDKLSNNQNDGEKSRADKIIEQYLKEIGFKKNAEARFSLTLEKSWEVQNNRVTVIEEYFSLGNKIRQESRNTKDAAIFSRIAVLNGENFYRNYFTKNNPPSVKRLKLNGDEEQFDNEVKSLKWLTFLTFFPINFESISYPQIELKYIGIAESKTAKADVLEAKFGKSRTFQFLFDVETHLLLMWKIVNEQSDGKKSSVIYYFDEYESLSGIKVATKIRKFENDILVEEKKVKTFSPNPIFLSDFFELK